MTMKNYQSGFLYLILSTIFLAIQLLLFIKGNAALAAMDFSGWLFFITSCFSHATTLALIPFLLLYLPLATLRHWKIGGSLMVAILSIVSVLLFLDMQVYDIYRFHINGFILNMVFSSGASEVFAFDTLLYLKEFSLFALFIGIHILLWWTACHWKRLCNKRLAYTALSLLIGITLYAHGYHIYASFLQQQSVMKSRRLLPYYFPTTAYGLMTKMGFTPPVNNGADSLGSVSGDVIYPLHPIVADSTTQHPNIVMILIDSWNTRSLTPECMPHVYQYAQANNWYQNHFSCSNGTRSSVFGMFFSIPSYYWDVFESNRQSPVFIDELQHQGYQCQVYPSASFRNPPFNRVLFQHVKGLNVQTKGKTVYDRDAQLTKNFLADLPQRAASGKPFFSMLFYDLAHSYELPQERNTRFQPAWAFADYTKLNNDLDPTPFFNLYRNCCYQIDTMIHQVLTALDQAGLADNTIVVITGDHAQEFNENKKNFWGHNGNFSRWQICVPLIVHHATTGKQTATYTHRTTHYDIVPTLMEEALGVKNDIADYSVGHLLTDTQSRRWHVVGSELNYAFIIDGDTILEKTADGSLEVTDAKLNPVSNYKLDAKAFNQAITRLNRYMKMQ